MGFDQISWAFGNVRKETKDCCIKRGERSFEPVCELDEKRIVGRMVDRHRSGERSFPQMAHRNRRDSQLAGDTKVFRALSQVENAGPYSEPQNVGELGLP